MPIDRRLALMGGVHVPWPGSDRIIGDGEGFWDLPRPQQFA